MNHSRNPIFLGALLLVLSLSGAAAQTAKPTAAPAVPSAESVVQSYLDTMQAGDFQKSTELMHPGISKMEVISLKRDAGNWRVLLSGEMEGLAQALSKSMAGRA